MSEYDALLQEADAMVAADGEALSGRTVYDGMPESHPTMRLIRLRDNRAALAAALRASEARAEVAEKRERAYRDTLLDLGRDCCAEAECENPWMHKSLREYGYGHYRCPEHAPEAKGGE
jgi:hypothetical protein